MRGTRLDGPAARVLVGGLAASALLLCGCASGSGTRGESDCARVSRIWRADLPGTTSSASDEVTPAQFAKVSADLAAAAGTVSDAALRTATQGLAHAYGQLAQEVKQIDTGGTTGSDDAAMSLYVTSAEQFTKLCGQG